MGFPTCKLGGGGRQPPPFLADSIEMESAPNQYPGAAFAYPPILLSPPNIRVQETPWSKVSILIKIISNLDAINVRSQSVIIKPHMISIRNSIFQIQCKTNVVWNRWTWQSMRCEYGSSASKPTLKLHQHK